jgi:hypothetical protein
VALGKGEDTLSEGLPHRRQILKVVLLVFSPLCGFCNMPNWKSLDCAHETVTVPLQPWAGALLNETLEMSFKQSEKEKTHGKNTQECA